MTTSGSSSTETSPSAATAWSPRRSGRRRLGRLRRRRSWREGLDIYLESLAESAQLNEIGVGVAEDGIVTDLANRLRDRASGAPTIPTAAEQEIRRPIIIVGQPRTGTTILHDLMAQDPANRAPLSWEIERPVPAPRTATYETDPRIDESQAGFDLVESFIPGFTAFHELGAPPGARRTCGSSPATSARCSTPCSSRCRRTTAGCCTRPTWRRRTAGTAGSCSTCSPSTTPERWLLKSPAHLWRAAGADGGVPRTRW